MRSCTFLNFFFWKIAFFSFVSLTTASIVDESFSPYQDVYDAILTTLFLITFVILFSISNKKNGKKINTQPTVEPEITQLIVKPEVTQPTVTVEPETTRSLLTKNNLLPLLDDTLYNTVTWGIPLTVSFAYSDLLNVKLFSIVNMCLHVSCAIITLAQNKRISDGIYDDITEDIFTTIYNIPYIIWNISGFIITQSHNTNLSVSYFTDNLPDNFQNFLDDILITSITLTQYALQNSVKSQNPVD
ncbi:1819_t:CDS:2 [Diversispora eburnea]|uniref:1819_t:CDS:1 n=1 Tax=Diversispora eburnea TaxID=1213867 RepID=A0A9N9EVQ2_9GLOM|nr:1819_t:CDS:2 [Diversispora eburnea]